MPLSTPTVGDGRKEHMKRNTLFGGFALLVAGAAIGGGAAVTSNAMAASGGDAPPTAEVTIVSIGADGDAVKCTYTGDEATAMMPQELPAGSMTPIEVGEIAGTDGAITVSASVDADGSTQVVDVGGGDGVTAAAPLPADIAGSMQVVGLDDARQGTPEECEAMKNAAPTGNGIIAMSGTVSVSGDAPAGIPVDTAPKP